MKLPSQSATEKRVCGRIPRVSKIFIEPKVHVVVPTSIRALRVEADREFV